MMDLSSLLGQQEKPRHNKLAEDIKNMLRPMWNILGNSPEKRSERAKFMFHTTIFAVASSVMYFYGDRLAV